MKKLLVGAAALLAPMTAVSFKVGGGLLVTPRRTLLPRATAVSMATRMPAPGLEFATHPGGEIIKCQAAVAMGVDDLQVLEVEVGAPGPGEVRLKVVANALCHTDCYTLEGSDPEGLFPSILGHEAGAIVESVGRGVTSVKPGDKVVPCYTPQCREKECIFCASPKTNLCPKIRATQGKGVMPDGTTRLRLADGDKAPVHHFMGTSTFAEYTVVAEISCAKVDDDADLESVCLLGCGVSTGWGAVWKTTVSLSPRPLPILAAHNFFSFSFLL
jgi:S-(hydroxymethyl)glutathione dehydrogenase/alcohol dehydrogenase